MRARTLLRNLRPIAIAICALPAASRANAQSRFWSGMHAGPHAVGFRIVDTVDVTRSFPSAAGAMEARPMRLYVWYPAVATPSARPVTWGDVVAESYPLHTPPSDPKAFTRGLYGSEMDGTTPLTADARVDSLSRLPMAARMMARAAPGRFPVILITPGSPGAFMVAAELLASNGFVVIGAPQRAHGTVDSRDFVPNAASIDAEVEDLEFSLGAARGWRNGDALHVGVMGFSTGGLTAIAFTLRSRVPSAVVSVEGWEGMEAGTPFIRGYRHYDAASFRAPYLLLGKEAEEPSPAFRKTSAFLDSMRAAPRWRVAFDSATHGDFVGLSRNSRRIFRRSNEYLLAFFRSHLATPRSPQWLPSQPEPGVRVQHFDTVAGPLGSEEFFRLAETNPAGALATLRERLQRDSAYVVPFAEASINRLANLTRFRRPSDGVILYEIVALGYPRSARAAVRLSDAYLNVGRRDDARTAARRALELIDGDSTVAADQRDALRTRMQAQAAP